MLKIFGTETQATIAAWALEAFGDVKTTRSILTRAGCEMAELVHAIECEEPVEKIASEIADVIIVLCRYPSVLGGEYVGDCGIHSEERIAYWAAEALHIEHPVRCVGYLIALTAQMRIDIGAAIDAKMKINRARKWMRKGAGHGQHVAETPGINAHDQETLRLAREYRDACAAVQPVWHAFFAEASGRHYCAEKSEEVRRQISAPYKHASERARDLHRMLVIHASEGVLEVGG